MLPVEEEVHPEEHKAAVEEVHPEEHKAAVEEVHPEEHKAAVEEEHPVEEDKVAVEEEDDTEDDHAADILQSTQKKTGWRRRALSWGSKDAGKMPHAPSIAMTGSVEQTITIKRHL